MIQRQNHTIEEVVEEMTQIVIEKFIVSGYPNRPLYISAPGEFELEIRIPPALPDFILNKFTDIRAGYRACPSIEVIELPQWLQRKGFFGTLVRKLGALDGIECVCISNVANKEFSTYLDEKSEWQALGSQSLVGYKSFFQMSVASSKL
jgi:hypothetical protein